MAPTVFSLTRDGDPAAAVMAAAETLVGGGLCALPTETGYSLAAGVAHGDRLLGLGGGDRDRRLTLHAGDIDAACAHGTLGPRALRLASQYWPGPLTLVVRAAGGGTDTAAATHRLRLPAHPFTQEVLRRSAGAWTIPAAPAGKPPLGSAAAIAAAFGDDLTLVVDDGDLPTDREPTVLWAAGPVFRVEHEGALRGEDLLTAAARRVLFVCTGNTCRSPLAAALARRTVSAALGVDPTDLVARGLWIASAGIAAGTGEPASSGSLEAGAEIGLDLSGHRSRRLDSTDLLDAAAVYCLSRSHRDRIIEALPQFESVVHLLDPAGGDIADPFGGDLEIYRVARDEIRAAIDARTEEITALAQLG